MVNGKFNLASAAGPRGGHATALLGCAASGLDSWFESAEGTDVGRFQPYLSRRRSEPRGWGDADLRGDGEGKEIIPIRSIDEYK
jgi:hypothetical protein